MQFCGAEFIRPAWLRFRRAVLLTFESSNLCRDFLFLFFLRAFSCDFAAYAFSSSLSSCFFSSSCLCVFVVNLVFLFGCGSAALCALWLNSFPCPRLTFSPFPPGSIDHLRLSAFIRGYETLSSCLCAFVVNSSFSLGRMGYRLQWGCGCDGGVRQSLG